MDLKKYTKPLGLGALAVSLSLAGCRPAESYRGGDCPYTRRYCEAERDRETGRDAARQEMDIRQQRETERRDRERMDRLNRSWEHVRQHNIDRRRELERSGNPWDRQEAQRLRDAGY
jgi:hypothetical protein